ncbi:thioesterase family protein [Bacteroides sp. 519]|uniref:acyl-CoA thioesterase n=1 Tax=Bacteroides sp. 519 TaxID=2302937 RepID=UPI0013D6CD9B|nr:acyl-CoA thioesterase [Bacteroides sp. 519]NDV58762.1 acyl-CoA thioesterase [Bacteroides sp. 519]
MKRKKEQRPAALVDRTTIKVRFSEVDAMHIVWHGEYIRYFEDGRESFGRHFGLEYMDVYNKGYVIPIVDLTCQYKQPLTVGEEAIVETRYINTNAAKIMFDYIIRKASDESIVATGSTIQVFLNRENNELELLNPAFYTAWRKKWEIE